MIRFLVGASKWAGAFLLAACLAWQASSDLVCLDSEATIHVGVPDVEIWVDDLRFHVDLPWEHPIVCQLPQGEHVLAMLKDGVEIYRETFRVEAGEDRVLTAWDEYGMLGPDARETPASASRTAFQWGAEGASGFAPDPERRN
jgi:hypothetical protein